MEAEQLWNSLLVEGRVGGIPFRSGSVVKRFRRKVAYESRGAADLNIPVAESSGVYSTCSHIHLPVELPTDQKKGDWPAPVTLKET